MDLGDERKEKGEKRRKANNLTYRHDELLQLLHQKPQGPQLFFFFLADYLGEGICPGIPHPIPQVLSSA